MKQLTAALYVATLFAMMSFNEIDMNGKIETRLTDKDKQNSTFFKMSRNSNRMALFDELQGLIRIKTAKAKFSVKKTSPIYEFTTADEVINLLGEPTAKLKTNALVYALNPSNGCKAFIEFDANKTVTSVSIKECKQ